MKIIDLLNKIANGEEVPKKIYCFNREFYLKENTYFGDTFTLMHYIQEEDLNDEVEILEEKKELHANDIEFNINVDKRDCVITLDENDLGIDKLHLGNCYFYKENDKWYVKKYDFKNFNLEEKKIPEKLDINLGMANMTPTEKYISNTVNEIIDYLKSKGDE